MCADIRRFSGKWPQTKTWRSAFTRWAIAADLAEQLIAILQSPELQHQMAQHNFAAGLEMTMTSVVKNYLRWFELNRCKKVICKAQDCQTELAFLAGRSTREGDFTRFKFARAAIPSKRNSIRKL